MFANTVFLKLIDDDLAILEAKKKDLEKVDVLIAFICINMTCFWILRSNGSWSWILQFDGSYIL